VNTPAETVTETAPVVAESTISVTEAPVSAVPTDSILRRHYEALQNS
jgi:hypothetical protein